MIISMDTEKAYDKIQHSFIIKTQGNQHRRTYFKIIKGIPDKPIANIFSKVKIEISPLRSRARQRCPLLRLLFSIILEVLDNAIREEKEIKRTKIGKEVISLLADNMLKYIENPKYITRNY